MTGIYRSNNERIKQDVERMKVSKTEIDTLVNSKVDRSEVMSWVNAYVARVLALRNLNPAVTTLDFRATGFE